MLSSPGALAILELCSPRGDRGKRRLRVYRGGSLALGCRRSDHAGQHLDRWALGALEGVRLEEMTFTCTLRSVEGSGQSFWKSIHL